MLALVFSPPETPRRLPVPQNHLSNLISKSEVNMANREKVASKHNKGEPQDKKQDQRHFKRAGLSDITNSQTFKKINPAELPISRQHFAHQDGPDHILPEGAWANIKDVH